eukprot:4659577-Prymnesium_polylepis.1
MVKLGPANAFAARVLVQRWCGTCPTHAPRASLVCTVFSRTQIRFAASETMARIGCGVRVRILPRVVQG